MSSSVGIIGFGSLGRCLSEMFVQQNRAVLATSRRNLLENFTGVEFQSDNVSLVEKSNVIILAVKPTQVRVVCEEIKSSVSEDTPIISSASAISLGTLHKWLPHTKTIVRCMPNIPCKIGQGVVPFLAKDRSSNDLIQDLFAPNVVIPMINDDQIDVATIISGCGPAFFAWFSNHLYHYGLTTLPLPHIQLLLAQTMIGTAHLLKTTSPPDIISAVASPHGATAAALEELKYDTGIREALINAYNRIQDLTDDSDR